MKLSMDPFIEHEFLSQMPVPEEKRFRETKIKFAIKDWDHPDQGSQLEFVTKKNGSIEIWLHTFCDRKVKRTHRCDEGHHHPVIVREKVFCRSFEMDPKEAKAFKAFLERHGKWA